MQEVCIRVNRVLLILLLSGIAFSSHAQKFRKGFIIEASGDTTIGFVNYRLRNRGEVKFKTNLKSRVNVYGPTEVSGFGIDGGRFYTSQKFDIPDNPSGLFFYENLVIGELSLYKGDKVFLFKKDSEIAAIRNLDKTKPVEEQRQQRRNNLLSTSSFLVGCDQSLINRYGFKESERELMQLAIAYNECVQANYVEYNSEKLWARFEPGLLVGFNNSKISFPTNVVVPHIGTLHFDKINSVFVGSEIKITSPRVDEKLGLLFGIHYQKTDYYGFATETSNFGQTHNDVIIRTSFIRFPFGLSYRFGTDLWPIDLKGGIQINSILNYSQNRTEYEIETIGIRDITTLTEYNNEYEKNGNYGGYWFGLGTEKPINDKLRVTIEVRYEINSSMTTLSSETTNFQLLLGLKL